MKKRVYFLIAFCIIFQLSVLVYAQQPAFDDFFLHKSLRIDFYLGGNYAAKTVYFEQMKEEPFWGGPVHNLVDPFNYGGYRFQVFDSASNQLIYSKGFSTLFEEWQTTEESHRLNRCFYQVAVFPYPKKTVRFEIDTRNWQTGKFENIYSMEVSPANYFILHETPEKCPVKQLLGKGDPASSLDIAVIAEGYTRKDLPKFEKDIVRVMGYIMEKVPYTEFKNNINVYALESASQESGTDIPGEHEYHNTVAGTSFYTFDVSRYLTTFDMKTLYDLAANVPYDQIFVLINSKRYGGGGFYNLYTGSTADHELTPRVAVHEFGHGFAGLGDEYYDSEVAYSDFYNLEVEPWEPNLTTNVDFASKWKYLIKPGTPVPTPREEQYKDAVGMFEGGGYVAKGVFSPMMDCIMKSNKPKVFCQVCQRAIRLKLLFYCDKPIALEGSSEACGPQEKK